ncbi:MAG: zf-HC2 domain-containing protein [Oscillospiraceae bacterium]|nr:zf-HC2 domain-containing protein [Oscillospiraceae bacterium]
MKACKEYIELISAQVDCELTETEQSALNEHLSACESCSAFHELFKEITAATHEAVVEVPDALSSNVMKEVNDLKKTEIQDNKKSHNALIFLKRYLPAVACLAIILLALPWFVVNQLSPGSDRLAPAATPAPTSAAPGMLYDSRVLPEAVDYDDAAAVPFGGGAAVVGGAGGIMPDFDSASEAESFAAEVSAPDEPAFALPMPAPTPSAPESVHRDMVEDEDSAAEVEWNQNHVVGVMEDTEAPSPQAAPTPVAIPDELVPEEGMYGRREAIQAPEAMEAPERNELDMINELINQSLVWIEITGELPARLMNFESEPVGDWIVWDKVFRIPTDVADELISELRGNERVSVTFANRDGDYAVVLYTSGR